MKTRSFKLFVCLLLVFCFCLTTLVGCSREQSEGEEVETTEAAGNNGGGEESSDVETETQINDSDELRDADFGGAQFRILARSDTNYEYLHDKNASKEISNAIYTREAEVEERFNVEILVDEKAGSYKADCELMKTYQTSVASGFNDYSLVSNHMVAQATASVNGYTANLANMSDLNMQKEWWGEQFYESCCINGKFFIAVGDIGHTLYEYMQCIIFNKDMTDTYIKNADETPVDLYQMVKDGDWTYEKLKDYTKLASTSAEEIGLLINGHATRGLPLVFEVDLLTKDESRGYPVYSFPTTPSETYVTFADDLLAFLNDTPQVVASTGIDNADCGTPKFAEKKTMFYAQQLKEVTSEKVDGMNLGILPLPKYNDDQLEYHTVMRDSVTAVSVPKNVKNEDMAGLVTEAMCMYSYQNVRPAYVETVMKGQKLDTRMGEIFDMMRAGVVVEFLTMFNASIEGTPYSLLANLHESSGATGTAGAYTTKYGEMQSKYQAGLKNIYKNAYGVTIE